MYALLGLRPKGGTVEIPLSQYVLYSGKGIELVAWEEREKCRLFKHNGVLIHRERIQFHDDEHLCISYLLSLASPSVRASKAQKDNAICERKAQSLSTDGYRTWMSSWNKNIFDD